VVQNSVRKKNALIASYYDRQTYRRSYAEDRIHLGCISASIPAHERVMNVQPDRHQAPLAIDLWDTGITQIKPVRTFLLYQLHVDPPFVPTEGQI
jgi:hypothetical protein